MEILHSLSETVSGFAQSDYALWILFALAFAESSFFPIPPDVLMIPLALANPSLAILYALVTTGGSVLGGIFGFWIGDRGGKPVLNKFASGGKMALVKDYYNKYDIWAVGMAALTPIPYKIFTISAGVFDLDFKRFILASVLGRGARFFVVGILIFIFGPTVKAFLEDYFEITILVFTVLLVGGFWLVGYLGNRKAKELAKNKNARPEKKN